MFQRDKENTISYSNAGGVVQARLEVRRYETDGIAITAEFVEPATGEIALPNGKHLLQRIRTATGAKYAGDGIEFWNKGNEALLDIGRVEHRCGTQ